MKSTLTSAEALKRLQHLLDESGNQDVELLQYFQRLVNENENLQRNLMKLRSNQAAKAHTTSSMHSKLIDALRE